MSTRASTTPPGILPLAESTAGKGWAGPWRKRTASENQHRVPDPSPSQLEIVHGEMNVRWPIPGGRLGALQMPAAESGGTVCYLRPLQKPLRLDRDGVTFVSLMIRETERLRGKRPQERLRLTFRSSADYNGRTISFGHRAGFQPLIQTGNGSLRLARSFCHPRRQRFGLARSFRGELATTKSTFASTERTTTLITLNQQRGMWSHVTCNWMQSWTWCC